MTQSYKQIQKQIEALQRQADKLLQEEIKGVVGRIKEAIAHYGLTSEQLGFGGTAARKAQSGKTVGTQSAKYSDGLGNSWSGRGPRPRWLRDALAAGRSLEEFTGGSSSVKSKGSKAKGPKKRKSRTHYRDQAGHVWSAMGPRPRWLTEALAAGKTLEELAG